jgi:hypothetical protein
MYGAILKGPGLTINTNMSHAKMKRRRTWNEKQNHGQITTTGTENMHTRCIQEDISEDMCITFNLFIEFFQNRCNPS